MVDSGEVVGAGTPLLVLVDLDRLYLKVYVPEVEIGKLRLGLPARVYTDAFPDQPFAASVRHIASQAEFTPKEVQTPDERVKLVYAVKLYLTENPGHRLTPGLPADAVIRWDPDVPWERPRW
jgi:HlyD family secretion protein